MQIKTIFSMLILGILLTTSGFGQTTKSVTVQMAYDDNAFHNYQAVTDYITQLNIYLAKDFRKTDWSTRFYYTGNLNFFTEYTDRFSQYHKFGMASSKALGESGAVLNLGGNVAVNRYKELYDYTNYVQSSGYINAKIRPAQSVAFQVGYIVKYRDYENLSEFTHFEHRLYGRASFFLPTKTSVILYSRYGLKDYKSQTMTTVITDTLNTSSGMGRGPGSSTSATVIYSDVQTPSTSQFIGSIKVGQSLTAKTGLSVECLRRISLTNSARYSSATGEVWTYNTEDELYDDPYGYEGHAISTSLTQMLPWRTTVKMGYNYLIKDYAVQAFDLEGESFAAPVNREDTRSYLWLSIDKKFLRKSAFRNVRFFMDFYYMKNDSNDPYYNYDNSVFTFGSGFSF